MKAVICTKYGAPEVLQIQEVSKPIAREHEVLVRVVSTAVNSGDTRVRGLAVEGVMKLVMRFVLGFSKPRKPILGTVYAGMVEEVGGKVSKFKKGDKVFGMTGFKFGTYAEFITVGENDNVSLMPANATFDEAASLIFGGQTAVYFFAKVKLPKMKSPKVLIIGATGSVGSSAIQLAKYYGAQATAVCSTSGKALMQSLGVTKIIYYDKEDYLNYSADYDFIFDAVGKINKRQCKNLLAKNGIFKTVGGLEYAGESREQLECLKMLFENGHLKAIIDRTYSLAEIIEAHTYVDTGRKKGNVVVNVAG